MVVGAIALKDGDAGADAAGDAGRPIAGCGATALDEPDGAKVVVPVNVVDVVAVSAENVDAGAEDGAAMGADVKVAGVAVAGAGVAGACAVEPNVEPDAPVVDGVAAGASVDPGVEAGEANRKSCP